MFLLKEASLVYANLFPPWLMACGSCDLKVLLVELPSKFFPPPIVGSGWKCALIGFCCSNP